MSTPFKDDNNREWRIHLTLGKVKKINDELGLDLLAPWDGRAIDAVTKDVMRFAQVLALAVDFGEDNTEVTGEALADGLRGEGLDRALLAFWKDLSGFFVGAQRVAFRTLVARAFEMWEAIWNEGTRKATEISTSDMLSIMNTPSEPPAPPTNPETSGD
jgi:hypothetical protein